jgi:hypothetical protein
MAESFASIIWTKEFAALRAHAKATTTRRSGNVKEDLPIRLVEMINAASFSATLAR